MDLASLILQLLISILASWGRMFAALAVSAVLSIFIGIWMATSEAAGKVLLPILDILQTLPILAFFPFALYVFVFLLPSYIGVNAAVIFLIITSMLWNMIFGVYEAVNTMPKEFFEVAALYKLDFWQRLRLIFIPGSMPRLVEQSMLSWSIGLFYLVTSEIFSVGAAQKSVTYGIGVQLVKLAPPQGSIFSYLIAIALFIFFVVMTRLFFFKPIEDYSKKYMKAAAPQKRKQRRSLYERSVDRFLIRHLGLTNTSIRIGPLSVRYRKRQQAQRQLAAAEPAQAKQADSRQLAPKLVFVSLALLFIVAIAYEVVTIPNLLSDEAGVVSALAQSFARVWLAYLVILAIAVPLSIYLVFMTKGAGKYLTFFQIVSSVPATVLLPLAVEAFNGNPVQGEIVAFIIFFLSGLWYVVFGMLSNGLVLPSTVSEVRRIFGVRGWSAWRNIYIKALVPGLITGSLTAIAAEWNASIVAEYFTSQGAGAASGAATYAQCLSGPATSGVITSVGTGIGRLLNCALAFNNGNVMLLAVVSMVAMILIVNTLVWKRFYKNMSKIYR